VKSCPTCGQLVPETKPARFIEDLPADYRGLAAWNQSIFPGMVAMGAPDHETATLDGDTLSATIRAEEKP
jgi:hypothetical protein